MARTEDDDGGVPAQWTKSPCLAVHEMRVVALLTCHNRKELTLRCLTAFFAQCFTMTSPTLESVVVDDGSTDGTGDAIRAHFPAARVVDGSGSLYWARGMQLAESHAMVDEPDYFLWLNDDTVLDRFGLDRLLNTSTTFEDAVIVGALLDPDTSALTYSGVVLSSWHPLRVRLVAPAEQPVDADTFNGNVVLVPRTVYRPLGRIDGAFSHGQADFDYGLRARRAGYRVLVAPGSVGTCRRGGTEGTFNDTTLPLALRWQLVRSPTGLPPGSHARYLRRHGGHLWPLFWFAPYAKLITSALMTAPRRRRSQRLRAPSGEAP